MCCLSVSAVAGSDLGWGRGGGGIENDGGVALAVSPGAFGPPSPEEKGLDT